MEQHAVIEALAGKVGDPLDVPGRQVGPELDDDVAAAREGKGQALVGHLVRSRIRESAAAIFGCGGLRQR